MIQKLFGALLLVMCLVNIGAAQLGRSVNVLNTQQTQLPDGIAISLQSDKTNYFLGESIIFYYRVENTGSNVFTISAGGDYRGASREDRFKVTAFTEGGDRVVDPNPVQMNFGGFMGGGELKPGAVWYGNIFVIEYCRFETPGRFDVRVFHDLGFGNKGDNDRREVSTTIALSAPSEDQARSILVQDENAKPYNGYISGQKAEARLDWYCIRWPAYLQPLVERAQSGRHDAVGGIASINTLAATRALVNLLGHTNFVISRQAATFLEWRLPHSSSEFQGLWGEARKALYVENVWDTQFASPLVGFSLRLLARTNREDFILASKYLGRVGTSREVPVLMQAVEFAAKQTSAEFANDIHYPSPIRACDALLGAAMAIDTNMNVASGSTRSPGEALLFIARHNGNERPFTRDEEVIYAKLLCHKLPYVRMKALENLPKEIPPRLVNLVTDRMTDANAGVRGFAFEVAKRMREPRHREIALTVLTTAEDQWLRWSAHAIALKYGARYDCAMAWCSHLIQPKDINDYTTHDALSHLFELTVGRGVGGGFDQRPSATDARALRKRWGSFLNANKSKIEKGHNFQMGKDMPADLLPAGFGF
jgi:hypothetical protein